MTLTPREYLHQHFGPKDRRWIDSLSEERCWDWCDQLTKDPRNLPNFPIWIKRNEKEWSGDIDQPAEVEENPNFMDWPALLFGRKR